MVKLTIIGRVSDGLALAEGPRYINQDNYNFSFYKQQAELILKQISRQVLSPSKMTILVDHHSFHYLMENGICFITLCDSSYPRKLAFHYLQDLQKEFEKFDNSLIIHKITRPYSFVKFESIIGNIRKQYIDTRTQVNLSKLNANRKQDVDIIIKHISQIIERRRNSEIFETTLTSPEPKPVSSVWGSPRLELIALKWTPITIIVVLGAFLLWVRLIHTDDFIVLGF